MAEEDVTDLVLNTYSAESAEYLKRRTEDPPENLHPLAAEMFVYMAEHATYQISNGASDYEDFSVTVTGLALTNCLVACEKSAVVPSFERPIRPDPWVKEAFTRQLMAELNREQDARLRLGLWRCCYARRNDCYHHRLTRRRRASALALLNIRAQKFLLEKVLGRSLGELSPDETYYALAASSEMLSFLTKTDPKGWAKFESSVGVSLEEMAALAGFLVFLGYAADAAKHSYWYSEEFLLELWQIYVQAWPQYTTVKSDSLVHAVRAFSMSPTAAADTLIQPPFFKLHDRYLRNPCFPGAGSQLAGLLTIAIRLNERAWSETLGSSLAKAADTLAAMLPQTVRLKIAARRRYQGGDVDLALYDVETRELFVCEVKTVYDKHRTDSLLSRFEEAKVNISKAASQLRATKQAVTSGLLTLRQLFGVNDPQPSCVHMVLLTWIDPIDLTMGTTDEDIFSVNFATFLWLAHFSEGDLPALANAIAELRNLWTMARMRPLDLAQPELIADLEVQSVFLESRATLASLPLSSITQKIIEQMPTIDEMSMESGTVEWVSYIEETAASLGKLR